MYRKILFPLLISFWRTLRRTLLRALAALRPLGERGVDALTWCRITLVGMAARKRVRVPIAVKLLSAFLLAGVLSLGITGWQSYRTARLALEASSFDRLTAVRETKKRQIESYFSRIRDQLRTVAEAPETAEMLQELASGFHAVSPQPEADDGALRTFYEKEFLPRLQANMPEPLSLDSFWPADPVSRHWQNRYLAANPYAVGSKDNLLQQTDNTPYDVAHARAHRVFRPFIHRFGFYDLFLVDAQSGHILYTVFKEADYGTNLLNGPYAGSNLGRVFRETLQSADRQICRLADYEAYAPSYSAPASFLSAPVFDGDKKIGVLVVQVPVNEINRVMTGDRDWAREGLGTTGETYLVGADFKMRTDSRFLLEDSAGFLSLLRELGNPAGLIDRIERLKSTILTLDVRTEAVEDALAGNRQTRIIRDYRHEPVLSSWTPLEIGDVKWVLLSEIDAAEAFAPVIALRQHLIWSCAALMVPLLGLGWALATSFARSARRLQQGIQRVRAGALDERVDTGSNDELGELAEAFNSMAQELQLTTVSKDYVDGVINSMNDALFIAACAPGTRADEKEAQLLVSDANPCALRLLGRTAGELRGLPVREFLRPGPEPAAPDAGQWTLGGITGLRDHAAQQPVEGHLLPKNGSPVPVTVSISLQENAEGQLLRVVLVVHDITEQKRAREALKHANAMKDSFLANTSHELRTPLNGIIGIAESLLEGAAGPITAGQRQNIEMMGGSARRLAHLVNDILDFSKLRHRTLDLQRRAVDARVVADVVIGLAKAQVARKPVEVLNHIPADAPLVHADENRLHQIFHNLIGNGIKFTPEGRVQVTAETVDNLLAIRVVDTGIGIPADKFGQIFDSFEQGDGSAEREYGGTGLGLAITRQLVELHGGTISVESTVGRGSCFSITLPISEEARPEVPEGQPVRQMDDRLSTVRGSDEDTAADVEVTTELAGENVRVELIRNRNIHILAVDDEPVNLQVLKNYLGHREYNVTLAAGGQEALELLRSDHPFDLVILDVMMPRMSGYECCRRIREQFSLNELPVLMLTAKNQVNDLVAGFDAGANDYLAKPFSRHELLSRVRTHVHLGRIHSAYGRFVPHEFLGYLNKDSLVDVQAGDQVQKLMTVLFADIRGFTALSEKLTLQENFDFINEYLGRMEPCIRSHHGFIDKFIGDAIMALFNAIGDEAVQASLAMLQRLEGLNAQNAAAGSRQPPVRIGIGLHTGSLILGTVGGEKRLDSTVISDAVNLASRVESMTKVYDVPLLLTGETYASLRHPEKFGLRLVDRVRASGKSQVTELYEVFDADAEGRRALKRQTLAVFNQAFGHYRRREFDEAITKFEAVLEVLRDDKPSEILLERCRRHAKSGVRENWDAVASAVPGAGAN